MCTNKWFQFISKTIFYETGTDSLSICIDAVSSYANKLLKKLQ